MITLSELLRLSVVKLHANTPKWQLLGDILGSQALRPLYFWLFAVPVVAKVLSELPTPIKFFWEPLEGPISIPLELPFNWKVLYFAALSMAIARTLFVVYCPDFVREHRDAEAAISTGVTVQRVRSIAAQFLFIAYRNRLPTWESFEREHLVELLRQYGVDLQEQREAWRAGSRSFPHIGDHIYRKLQALSFKVNGDGNYVIENRREREEIWSSPVAVISKDQLLRHLCWDLLNLQNEHLPWIRALTSAFAFLAVTLAIIPFLESVSFVLGRL